MLELRAWGVGDLRSFPWLDAPRGGALEAAERLLTVLGALASDGALTEVGRRMQHLHAESRPSAAGNRHLPFRPKQYTCDS